MLPEQTARPEALSQADIQEFERLEALDQLDIIDMPHDDAFDGVAELVKNIFDVPIAIVSVIDAHRQLYKACVGLSASEVARKDTFCTHTIRMDNPMVVPDATLDERFADHPMVVGAPSIRFYAGAPLRTSDGHNIGTLCAIDTKPRDFGARETAILQGLANLAMEQMETRQLAATDMLTGVLSRRAFLQQGARAVNLADRHKYHLSLITLDIDHFKSINDCYGHAAGDKALAEVATASGKCLRASDIFGRVGGEEFAILLPHTDRRGALGVAERLRRAIAGLPFEPDGTPRQLTASFGVSTVDIATRTMEGLLANADAALYQAKANGRNQVVGWHNQQQADEESVRRRVLKAGMIHFNGRMSTVDCTVRSLSQIGAGIDLSSSYGLPEKFGLMIRSDGFDKSCRMISQTERHIEVEFT